MHQLFTWISSQATRLLTLDINSEKSQCKSAAGESHGVRSAFFTHSSSIYMSYVGDCLPGDRPWCHWEKREKVQFAKLAEASALAGSGS